MIGQSTRKMHEPVGRLGYTSTLVIYQDTTEPWWKLQEHWELRGWTYVEHNDLRMKFIRKDRYDYVAYPED